MIDPKDITIIIPVKNNQIGIDRYLSTLLLVTPSNFFPKEIIIVDNNSDVPLYLTYDYPIPIRIILCNRQGPAAARNDGVLFSTTSWCLFNDSDCIPTSTTISGYCNPSCTGLAYQGMYTTIPNGHLSEFYQKHNSCNPMCRVDVDSMINPVHLWQPAYLVTSNCLLHTSLFDQLQGFDENIRIVASEDLEFGIRIKQHHNILINQYSVIQHIVEDDWSVLIDRFIRYGRGSGYLVTKYPKLLSKHGPFCAIDLIDQEQAITKLAFLTMNIAFNLGFLLNLPKNVQ